MIKKGKEILAIEPESIAEEMEIEAGDFLLAINGRDVADVFDFRMAQASEELEVLIKKGLGNEDAGAQWLLEIEKDEDEDLGLVFEDGLMDDMRNCGNKCIFCFIDQNAPNMRSTLYVKDDDYRLSFLHGNYITLTNMNQSDIDRILEHHISPINISIHATEPDLRIKMMNNPRAGRSLDFLGDLVDGGISLSLQIVLCKGYNDGVQLDKTIEDLSKYMPDGGGGCSLSVVPVGLTKYRGQNGLAALEPLDAADCANVVKQVKYWQDKLLKEKGTRFVFAADEFYLKAGTEMPAPEEYEDFPQIDNGVGMITAMRQEFESAIAGRRGDASHRPHITIITGVAAAEFMKELAAKAEACFEGLKINVETIVNEFYGEYITVVGLLTGKDIINQLKERELGDVVLLPKTCLRAGENVFLDDISLDDMAEQLGVEVVAIEPLGDALVAALLQR
ncbi:MAG: DUF512 domain-containing protein [Defluviitaleaceae bacterium]|nr:DUF512 domain-containing protein [Defluviitaleaceae bacterium]